jgi:hypothetical protein
MPKHLVLLVALSFVPVSAAGQPPKPSPAKSLESKSWEYCYQLSRKLGWDHEADEWVKFIQDCMAGGDVASYSK